MSTPLKLNVESRKQIGHANTKLSPQGLIPAIVYGAETEPHPVEVDAHELEQLFVKHGENLVLEITIDGEKPVMTLVREVQRDPLTSRPLHVDFMVASATKTVVTEVPVVLEGTPEGVRNEGGILNVEAYTIEIEALITNIPQQIEFDITDLGMLDVVMAGDLPLPEGVTLVTDPEATICSVVAPAAEVEEAPEGEEFEEAATVGESGAEEEGSSEEE